MAMGRSALWQQQAPSLLLSHPRCSQVNVQLRPGRPHRHGAETMQSARRRQVSPVWSSATRITMQAAPSGDADAHQSGDSRPDVPAQVAAADSSNGAAVDNGAVTHLLTPGAVANVEELCGVRVNVDDLGQPLVEYLVHWKVGTA